MRAPEGMMAIRSAVDHIIIADEKFVFRSLSTGDGDLLGSFLTDLSARTARRFQPHPLTREAAAHVCAVANRSTAVRFISLRGDEAAMVGYMVVEFTFPQEELERYRRYGISLVNEIDCRIAPAVADAYQDRGIGSAMMGWVLGLLRSTGTRSVVLFGGTQADNHRAIHFYEKAGFRRIAPENETPTPDIDMMINLNLITFSDADRS